MRVLIIACALSAVALTCAGQVSSRVAQLPGGTLEGNTYTNDAVGVTYEAPAGWTAAADLKVTHLDEKPDARANKCTKVLLWMKAPGEVKGRFNSIAALMAIDPACISGPEFPLQQTDKAKINKVVDKIIRYYKNAPFFSPYGVTILATRTPEEPAGRLTIQLVGAVKINANEDRMAPKEPLVVHTSFALVRARGWWVAWAYLADDASADELSKAKITFKGVEQ
jgi:hypothetical protein